jgi:hypothetical protein
MGSDVTNFVEDITSGDSDPVTASLAFDPALQFAFGSEGEEGINKLFDPLDLFGQRQAGDIEEAGTAARARITSLMRAANTMRQDVLARIKERDLRASEAAAQARRQSLLRTGRASTVLSR